VSSASPTAGPVQRGEAVRLALVYVAVFGMMGIQLPYWPVWLAHRGMEPDQIGVLLGVFTWARLAAPWAGSWADRHGHAHRMAAVLALASLVFTAAFAPATGFVLLLLLSAATGLTQAPILPLADGLAVAAAAAGRLDYGRVRVWGSAAFVLASSAGGLALRGRSPSLVLLLVVVAAVLLAVTTLFLPRATRSRAEPPAPPTGATGSTPPPDPLGGPSSTSPPGGVRALLERPRMITFLAAIACMQGSHAVLYGFGTRHWQAIGIAESTIGWMWAWGVIVEVCLFAAAPRVLARMRPVSLLALAGLGGVIRWPLLASVESVGVIFAVQTLHAATFAAMHLGAMNWIRDSVDAPAVQRATGLYVAIGSGVALGLGMPLAGVLFEHFAGQAYLAMAVASGLGLVFALRLRAGAATRSAAAERPRHEPSRPR
jgi:MFS transporter, PPP family, 3-phenylpropionic acid transporter